MQSRAHSRTWQQPNFHWQMSGQRRYGTPMQWDSLRKNELVPLAATRMDPEMIILSEVRQGKTNGIWYRFYYVKPEIGHKWIYLWNRNWLTDIENRLVVAKGEWRVGGGTEWEFWISRGKLLCMNNKVWLHSTGNCVQYPVMNHNGKEYIYIKSWTTLLYRGANTALQINYTSIK